MINTDCLVIGAGFTGATLAERMAAGQNRKVLVLEKRNHIGGNAHDRPDERGVLIHPYGPHIFHTNSTKIWEYLSRRMLDHPNITVRTSEDFLAMRNRIRARQVFFTGPIDAWFDYRYGKLPYRSLAFVHENLPLEHAQPAGAINYPNDHEYTRVTEFKYITGQQHPRTAIVREYPRNEGDPYYPVPRPDNEQLYKRYEALAARDDGVTFIGRLASYRYYNMDQVVAAALSQFR